MIAGSPGAGSRSARAPGRRIAASAAPEHLGQALVGRIAFLAYRLADCELQQRQTAKPGR